MSEFTLTDLRVGDFKDQNGNSWCNATFEEYGEPVTWVIKDPSKISLGTKYSGEIKDWTSSKGKVMPRFYREQAGAPSAQSQSSGKSDAYLKDVSNTAIMVYNGSLNYASQAGLNLISDKEDRRIYFEYVADATDELLKMVENVREGKREVKEAKETGYDKFKAKKAQLTNDFDEKDVPDFDEQ